MSVTTYARLRMFWGAYDLTLLQQSTPGYGETQIVTGGTSAAIGDGVGVRRLTLVLDRTAVEAGLDPAVMHFDILNMTGGNPDDTWTTGDFTTCEGYAKTMMSSLATYMQTNHSVTQYVWHRVGTGVPKPNPAERIFIDGSPVVGSGGAPELQCAASITFRTGVRKSWGRTYLPFGASLLAARRLSVAQCNGIGGAVNTFVTSLAASDFHLVVVSGTLNSSLNVEKIEVDDVPDVIRRRRHKHKVNQYLSA